MGSRSDSSRCRRKMGSRSDCSWRRRKMGSRSGCSWRRRKMGSRSGCSGGWWTYEGRRGAEMCLVVFLRERIQACSLEAILRYGWLADQLFPCFSEDLREFCLRDKIPCVGYSKFPLSLVPWCLQGFEDSHVQGLQEVCGMGRESIQDDPIPPRQVASFECVMWWVTVHEQDDWARNLCIVQVLDEDLL